MSFNCVNRRVAVGIALVLAVLSPVSTHAAIQASTKISRADAVALLVEADPAAKVRTQEIARKLPPMPLFNDVLQSEWYAPYLEAAFERGWIHGTADDRFFPGAYLTQGDAVILIANLRGIAASDTRLLGALSALRGQSLALPIPFDPSQSIRKQQWINLLVSAGVSGAATAIIQPPSRMAINSQAAMTFQNHQAFDPSIQAAQQTTPNLVPVSATQTGYKPDPVVQPRLVMPRVAAAQQAPVYQPTPQPTAPVYRPAVNQPAVGRSTAQASPPAVSQSFTISMPTLGIGNLTVTHPSDPVSQKGQLAVLQQGVGHLFSFPGQGGKILVYGHSSGYSWDVSKFTKIFRQINKLSVGDPIVLTYGGAQYRYTVTRKTTVAAGDATPYSQNGVEELVLYTCWPPDSIKQRYLVYASPVGPVAMR